MTPVKKHMDLVSQAGCVLANRGWQQHCSGRVELHHVATGSGLRSDYGVVGLCEEHHRGTAGLHGMGTKAFIRLYRPPGESEWGLILWVLEDIARIR